MKKIFLGFVLLALVVTTNAQNLVENPGFEDNANCPNSTSQMENANGWFNASNSPDYYHACSGAGGDVGVPGNILGWQDTDTGDGYVGMLAYGSFAGVIADLREYATGTLTEPLVVGEEYNVSFRANLSDLSMFAVSGMGAYFSTSVNANLPISSSPQVFTNDVINDTVNWVTVEGTFIADQAYTYVTIGNHWLDSEVTIEEIQASGLGQQAYYYIDDVVVEPLNQPEIALFDADTTLCIGEDVLLGTDLLPVVGWATEEDPVTIFSTDQFITVSPTDTTTYLFYAVTDTAEMTVNINLPPTVDLGPDVLVCANTPVDFDATWPEAEYLWNDNSTLATFTALNEGLVTVIVSNECGSDSDDAQLDYEVLPAVDLGTDSLICVGSSITLDATTTDATYLWSDNSTAPQLTVDQPGLVSVDVTIPCGIVSASIEIVNEFLPVVDLGNDTTLCPGEILTLDATNNDATYLWQDNTGNSTLNVNAAGTYSVAVTNMCGTENGSINIDYVVLPLVSLGVDTTLCVGQSLQLDAQIPEATYEWNTTETTPIIIIDQPGTYSVDVTVECATLSDDIVVTYDDVPVFDLGPDAEICENTTLLLDATAPESTYSWQNGTSQPTLLVSSPGTYTVDVTNHCGTTSDTLEIAFIYLPLLDLGPDTTLCPDESIELETDILDGLHAWSTGETNASIVASESGIYSVVVNTQCGAVSDDVIVNYYDLSNAGLIADTTICQGDFVTLNAETFGATYLWQNGTTKPTLDVDQPGIYTVEVTHKCGTFTDELRVDEKICECTLFAPNAITPDNDGINEVFIPILDCELEHYYFAVFNRWGGLVFESSTPGEPWDGGLNGYYAPNGVYAYLVEYIGVNKETVIHHGSISVIR